MKGSVVAKTAGLQGKDGVLLGTRRVAEADVRDLRGTV